METLQFNKNLIKEWQQHAKNIIESVGAKINYYKDLSWMGTTIHQIGGREPIINIEASLLAKKFGIVIGYPKDYQKIIHTKKYKIFHLTNLEKFKEEWNNYVEELLKK